MLYFCSRYLLFLISCIEIVAYSLCFTLFSSSAPRIVIGRPKIGIKKSEGEGLSIGQQRNPRALDRSFAMRADRGQFCRGHRASGWALQGTGIHHAPQGGTCVEVQVSFICGKWVEQLCSRHVLRCLLQPLSGSHTTIVQRQGVYLSEGEKQKQYKSYELYIFYKFPRCPHDHRHYWPRSLIPRDEWPRSIIPWR